MMAVLWGIVVGWISCALFVFLGLWVRYALQQEPDFQDTADFIAYHRDELGPRA